MDTTPHKVIANHEADVYKYKCNRTVVYRDSYELFPSISIHLKPYLKLGLKLPFREREVRKDGGSPGPSLSSLVLWRLNFQCLPPAIHLFYSSPTPPQPLSESDSASLSVPSNPLDGQSVFFWNMLVVFWITFIQQDLSRSFNKWLFFFFPLRSSLWNKSVFWKLVLAMPCWAWASYLHFQDCNLLNVDNIAFLWSYYKLNEICDCTRDIGVQCYFIFLLQFKWRGKE